MLPVALKRRFVKVHVPFVKVAFWYVQLPVNPMEPFSSGRVNLSFDVRGMSVWAVATAQKEQVIMAIMTMVSAAALGEIFKVGPSSL
jgi:hypothetical protein